MNRISAIATAASMIALAIVPAQGIGRVWCGRRAVGRLHDGCRAGLKKKREKKADPWRCGRKCLSRISSSVPPNVFLPGVRRAEGVRPCLHIDVARVR